MWETQSSVGFSQLWDIYLSQLLRNAPWFRRALKLMHMEKGGNLRAREWFDSCNVSGLDLKRKYESEAAEMYRRNLKALVENREAVYLFPVQPAKPAQQEIDDKNAAVLRDQNGTEAAGRRVTELIDRGGVNASWEQQRIDSNPTTITMLKSSDMGSENQPYYHHANDEGMRSAVKYGQFSSNADYEHKDNMRTEGIEQNVMDTIYSGWNKLSSTIRQITTAITDEFTEKASDDLPESTHHCQQGRTNSAWTWRSVKSFFKPYTQETARQTEDLLSSRGQSYSIEDDSYLVNPALKLDRGRAQSCRRRQSISTSSLRSETEDYSLENLSSSSLRERGSVHQGSTVQNTEQHFTVHSYSEYDDQQSKNWDNWDTNTATNKK
ncbi:uncharacterized protein LOC126329582 isoform X2 [Schistocerca gregaria]|uniref:uncharacterized protein LOC126329582 isoform X2 n=1 Tax=Schistocerca gregaria TaxID=7010 RepID=UPI00211F4382|nr:uncharacterized protein LOC126329582 isoform X2 [Schistocerca gregaria]